MCIRSYSKNLFIVGQLLLIGFVTNAQFAQQGPKLVGSGAVANASQGYSVAISADGNTAIAGSYSDNNGAGAVWIYTLSNDTWVQQGSKLVGTGATGNALQGHSVSISSDGNTAIIGGHSDNSGAGAVWVFTRSGGVWSQQGSKLVGTGAVGNASQGWSVSLSADGNTAIIGGYTDNSGAGAAWVFTRTGGVWSQQGSKLVGTGATGNAAQSWSVCLSFDGGTAIVGGYDDNTGAGAAWIYKRSGSTWTQQGFKLVGTGAIGKAAQGSSVSLSSEGNTAIIGGYKDNNQAGAAWVFTRSVIGVWLQQGSKLVGTGAIGNASQGSSVSVSFTGNTVIIGGYKDNNQTGAAWMYNRNGSVWTQQGPKLVGTGAVGNASQGYSVSLSSDGNSAIIGGVDNGQTGAAWVFIATPKHMANIYPRQALLVSPIPPPQQENQCRMNAGHK